MFKRLLCAFGGDVDVFLTRSKNRNFSPLQWAQLLICDCFSIRMRFFHPQRTPHNQSNPGLSCSPCHVEQKQLGIRVNFLRKQSMDLLFCAVQNKNLKKIITNLNRFLWKKNILACIPLQKFLPTKERTTENSWWIGRRFTYKFPD